MYSKKCISLEKPSVWTTNGGELVNRRCVDNATSLCEKGLWLLRPTPTWAVGLLAQEEREASDLVLSPGCGQRGGQRRVVGVGRQLEGLPLELHQRLITSSWKKKKTNKKKTFSHTSGVCEPYKHLTRLEKGVGMSVSHRDEEEAAIELFLWKLQQSAAAVAMATAAANNTGSC